MRGVLATVEDLIPYDVGCVDAGRKIRCRRGGKCRHAEQSGAGLGPGVVAGAERRRGGSGGTGGGIGYHLSIIYRAIEKYKPEPADIADPPKRRPGRPRATPAPASADPREDILDVAAHLFATNGYAATGTREIAAAAGLRQASLFHYFRRKEDLFAELLDRTVSPSLESTKWLMRRSEPAPVRLYVLARQDVMNLFGSRQNLAALQLLPEARDERFADFWTKRSRLRARYRTLVREMARGGLLVDAPIEFVTDIVFGAVEATMTWSERARRASSARTAEAVAAAAVRGVMAKPPSADELVAAGSRVLRTT